MKFIEIIQAFKKAQQKRSSAPCQILEAPGMCNGLVNLFHRKVLRAMKQRESSFSLKIAQEVAEKIENIFEAIVKNDGEATKRLDQLCFFQSPQDMQPEGSLFEGSEALKIDDIAAINHAYNKRKSQVNSSVKTEDPRYLSTFDDVSMIQDFAGCVSKDDLRKVLAYYLPLHQNEIIRMGTALHVIGIGYHVDEEGEAFSIFDPGNKDGKLLQIIRFSDLTTGISNLIEKLHVIFNLDSQSIEAFESDDMLTLSLKFYSDQTQQHPEEKDGATYLMELLAENDSVEQVDRDGYDALFISAEYGHLRTARALLSQYELRFIYSLNADQGRKFKCSPIKVSEDHGHKEIADLLKSKSTIYPLISFGAD